MLILNNIQTQLGEPEEAAVARALKILGAPSGQVKEAYVSKTSLDARKQRDIRKVNTVVVRLHKGEERFAGRKDVRWQKDEPFSFRPGKMPDGPVIVAGFGPAGMFAALLLAKSGVPVTVLERGGPVEERVQAVERFWNTGILDESCNVQFGEGGAGTFSDGKLTTRIHDPLCAYVLEQFARHGAPAETLRKAKPHIGTDHLRDIVRSIRREIIQNGGEVRFHAKLTGITVRGGRLTGISVNGEAMPTAFICRPSLFPSVRGSNTDRNGLTGVFTGPWRAIRTFLPASTSFPTGKAGGPSTHSACVRAERWFLPPRKRARWSPTA